MRLFLPTGDLWEPEDYGWEKLNGAEIEDIKYDNDGVWILTLKNGRHFAISDKYLNIDTAIIVERRNNK